MPIVGGTEALVNTYTTAFQSAPVVTRLNDGGWVTTWYSYQDLTGEVRSVGTYAQAFNEDGSKRGLEVRVNTVTDKSQSWPVITETTDGGYVIAWLSDRQVGEDKGYDVYMQKYDVTGTPTGGEKLVNTVTAYDEKPAGITPLSNGGWVVNWTGYNSTSVGSTVSQDIFQQAYDANGTKIGTESRVNTYATNYQDDVRTIALPNGEWLSIWTSWGQEAPNQLPASLGLYQDGVYMQRFEADGDKSGVETRVNTTVEGTQTSPSLLALEQGGWVVIWHGLDGEEFSVFMQRYDATGATVGTETKVNTTTTSLEYFAEATALEGGGWVVTWREYTDSTNFATKVYQQAYDSDGDPLGGETLVNTNSIIRAEQKVVALDGGGWVVVWRSGRGSPVSNTDLYQQAFNADGSKNGGETAVNIYKTSYQGGLSPSGFDVTALEDGKWLVTWESQGQVHGDTFEDIYQRIFSLSDDDTPTDISSPALKIKEGAANNTKIGQFTATDPDSTVFTWKLLDSAGGRFKIDANDGELRVANGLLLDYEKAKTHTISVEVSDGVSTRIETFSVAVTDVTSENLTGTGAAESLRGGSSADTLKGGNGNDTLKGGGGKDSLDGGEGSDTADYSDKIKAVEVKLNTSTNVKVKVDGTDEDTIKNIESLIGGSKNDKLTGDGKGNALDGRQGNDSLDGGSGADTLIGGTGKDTLTGGTGGDKFVFNTALGSTNIDTIKDFAPGDKIQLDDAIFAPIGATLDTGEFRKGTAAKDGNDFLIYDKLTGKLSYDADGNMAGVAVQIAVLTNKPTLASTDFVIV